MAMMHTRVASACNPGSTRTKMSSAPRPPNSSRAARCRRRVELVNGPLTPQGPRFVGDDAATEGSDSQDVGSAAVEGLALGLTQGAKGSG